MIPRAPFLPRNPRLALPPLSCRERREVRSPRSEVSAFRKWRSALAIVLIAIGVAALLYLAFDCAFSALTWIHVKP